MILHFAYQNDNAFKKGIIAIFDQNPTLKGVYYSPVG